MDTLALFLSVVALLVVIVGAVLWGATRREARRIEREKRGRFITEFAFPRELSQRVRELHPGLTQEQAALVLEGLRQYFLACLAAQDNAISKQVGMPSRAVDDAWHEFIVMTRAYEAFCRQAFGRYLHHTPERQMEEPMDHALANTLQQFRSPSPDGATWAMLGSLPLLFAMDHALGLSDGFRHDDRSLDDLDQQRRLLAQRATPAGGDGGGSAVCGDSGSHSGCGDLGAASCGGGSCGGGSGGGCGGG